MAGFDFDITCTQRQRPFVKQLLQFLQRLGKDRDCQIKYRWDKNRGYYVTVDGSLVALQSFQLVGCRSMIHLAEAGITSFPEPERYSLCEKIIDGYSRGLIENSEMVADIAARLPGGVPHSYYFDMGEATHIQGRMNDFSDLLAAHATGFIAPAQLLEECHSVLETLLKSALSKEEQRNKCFEQLVDLAQSKGYISESLQKEVVTLKDIRKRVKHRQQGISPERMDSMLPQVLTACHKLSAVIKDASSAT